MIKINSKKKLNTIVIFSKEWIKIESTITVDIFKGHPILKEDMDLFINGKNGKGIQNVSNSQKKMK